MTIASRRVAPVSVAGALLASVCLACSSGGGGESAPPAIGLSTGSLSFEAVAAGPAPTSQSFAVTNAGGGELAIPSVAIAYSSGEGWLTASVSGDRPPFTISVQPIVSDLLAGTYVATLAVRSNGASNTPQSVRVTLTVSEKITGPMVRLSSTSEVFTARSHREDPSARTVEASNGGGGTLAKPALRVAYEGAASGWLTATVAGEGAPYAITIRPVTTVLGAGTYRAAVTVESAGAAPAELSVTLTLTPTWTVLVYANADNALSTSLVSALAEMGEASLGEDVTVLVAADWSAGRTLPGGAPFEGGTDWFRVDGGGVAPELLAHFDEQDFDDPAVFARAVESAFNAFPADHHAVVLWGPGAGWQGFGGDEHDTPADAADDGTPMSAATIAQALSDALPAIGVTAPIELVGFDAPLMMGQEVAFAFRDVATTIVATTDLDLGPGWDWAATLSRLAADPYTSAAAFAAAEVQAWDAHHAGPADRLLRAHAALDLSRMAAYADAWSALSTASLTSSADWLAIARAQLAAAPGYGLDGWDLAVPQPTLRDAGALLDALAALPNAPVVADAAAAARSALAGVVIAASLGDVRVGSQAAVSVEAPLGARRGDRATSYASLEWAAATAWSDVLATLALNDDAVAPAFDRVAETSSPTIQDPPTIHVSSSDPDVALARLSLTDAAAGTSLGIVAQGTLEPNGTRSLAWDGNLARLEDGATSCAVFAQQWVEGGTSVLLVPGEISDGTASIHALAIVVTGEPSVDAVAVPVDGHRVVLSLSAFRGLTFTPALKDEAAGAWRPAGVSLAIPDSDAAALSFSRTSAPAGAYRLTTSVMDVWGNVASATDDVTVAAPFGI